MKTYTIIRTNGRTGSTYEQTGTLPELVEAFKYTLEKGESWQHEKGNSKINTNPKTIASLVKNINNSNDNAAMDGYCQNRYELKE